MMTKNSYYLSGLFLLFFIWSCSGPSTNNAGSEEGSEMESASEEERASPLKTTSGEIGNKSITVQYGSPGIKGRAIWGDLVPYEEVWRTGANEATYITLEEEVLIEGQPLAPGKYSLFTIPRANDPWTVIFNSDWDLEHGHFQYDEEKDVLRVEVDPTWVNESQEWLSIDVVSDGLEVKWEKLVLPITIE
ncbi:DUF2911 domain-containing protein [Cyclobacterium jeungdonense]|uniref:DUF2911 domain-containing protein n=1 Tax=Cyclobacterium jeungdonense TaxID=708087 RepID=A0ABT8C6N6_9BACT|nr:DUF2911 domain-containing protein [Cyclobacterium jeungdonense]MDN3687361.1 DUF2911 domain-containing protein [Cyclobacterium jeungdonense]